MRLQLSVQPNIQRFQYRSCLSGHGHGLKLPLTRIDSRYRHPSNPVSRQPVCQHNNSVAGQSEQAIDDTAVARTLLIAPTKEVKPSIRPKGSGVASRICSGGLSANNRQSISFCLCSRGKLFSLSDTAQVRNCSNSARLASHSASSAGGGVHFGRAAGTVQNASCCHPERAVTPNTFPPVPAPLICSGNASCQPLELPARTVRLPPYRCRSDNGRRFRCPHCQSLRTADPD